MCAEHMHINVYTKNIQIELYSIPSFQFIFATQDMFFTQQALCNLKPFFPSLAPKFNLASFVSRNV